MPLEPCPDGLLLAGARGAASGWSGWTLVLVEGDVVDDVSLHRALDSGSPARDPQRVTRLSIAPDALRLPGRRLFAPGELQLFADERTWSTTPVTDPEVPWELSQVNAAARAGHGAAGGWARLSARALSREQLKRDLDEEEALWLAELLLLAGEFDAVVVRATAALQRPLSPQARVRWAQTGLAAASTTLRAGEVGEFSRFLTTQEAAPPVQALWSWWSGRAAEQRGELNSALPHWSEVTAADPVYERHIDPWHEIARDRRAEVALRATATTARDLLRQPRTDRRALTSLVGAWAAAELPADELVQGWPPEAVGVLLEAGARGAGPTTEWRLDLLDQLHSTEWAPRVQVVALAAPLAARLGLSPSITWFERARRLPGQASTSPTLGLNPLALRAQDVINGVHAQVLAAVCWWLAAPNDALPLLRAVVELVHVDDVVSLLASLRDVAPGSIPTVIDLLCTSEDRTELVEQLLVSNQL